MRRHALAFAALLTGLWLLTGPDLRADNKEDQDKFVSKVKTKLRGKVEINAKDKAVTGIILTGNKIEDKQVKGLSAFPNLLKLDVSNTKVGDAGIAPVKDMAQLKELHSAARPSPIPAWKPARA